MSYFIPRPYICKKCGHKQMIQPCTDTHLLEWYCIKCLEKFLDENIGKMEIGE